MRRKIAEKQKKGDKMKILVDADACPVVRQAVELAREYGVEIELFCDTNHVLTSDYAAVYTIGAGRDAVDLALINQCRGGDIVLTQDYALAALVLAKRGYALNQNGFYYTQENIDGLLAERWESAKARRSKAKSHLKGPRKRSKEDDEKFRKALQNLLEKLSAEQE